MSSSLLERLETNFDDLTEAEQRLLLERLTRRIEERTLRRASALVADLDAMADDPEIRRELETIELEFQASDADGLELAP